MTLSRRFRGTRQCLGAVKEAPDREQLQHLCLRLLQPAEVVFAQLPLYADAPVAVAPKRSDNVSVNATS